MDGGATALGLGALLSQLVLSTRDLLTYLLDIAYGTTYLLQVHAPGPQRNGYTITTRER
jgi:alkylhydroperoxidase/carboxymuconolactone decarboxylase family protein YurZ|eukprot:SAG25_NODE_591_length_6692_cov_3.648718_1_plen_59_part_00